MFYAFNLDCEAKSSGTGIIQVGKHDIIFCSRFAESGPCTILSGISNYVAWILNESVARGWEKGVQVRIVMNRIPKQP